MTFVLDARTATDHFPGIGRYVVNLASALKGIAPELDLTLLIEPSAAASRLALPNLPRIACAVSPFSIKQQWIVPRQLRAMHATLYHSPYYLMPYRPGVPTVVTCYDLIPLIYPQYFSFVQRVIYRVTHQLALRTARAIPAISEATKADLVRCFHVDPDRIVVTPLAADTHFAPQSAATIGVARAKYNLPERYVLYFGSNKPHKNLVRLVQAWQRQNAKFRLRNIELVIAGQWDTRYPEAKQLAAPHVQFIGPVSDADLPALYSGASLFVFPSLYEGFGLPVLEAMACGAPVACSNASSLPEVIGEAGVLFDPMNVPSMADAIERVSADRAWQSTLRELGLRRAAQFTWERTAQRTIEVYRSVTQQR